MPKIIICGSRDFRDKDLMANVLQYELLNLGPDPVFILGGAAGADSLGEDYATENNIKKEMFYADWSLHGKGAGFIRNQKMAEVATHCIAFWDGKSPGTKNMIDLCVRNSIWVKCYIIKR